VKGSCKNTEIRWFKRTKFCEKNLSLLRKKRLSIRKKWDQIWMNHPDKNWSQQKQRNCFSQMCIRTSWKDFENLVQEMCTGMRIVNQGNSLRKLWQLESTNTLVNGIQLPIHLTGLGIGWRITLKVLSNVTVNSRFMLDLVENTLSLLMVKLLFIKENSKMEQFMDMEPHISVTHFGTKESSKMVKEQV